MKYWVIGYFLVLFVSTDILATANGPENWTVKNVSKGDVLNIREKPTWKSKKVGEIPHNGQCLQNLDCVGGLTMDEIRNLSKAEKKRIKKSRPKWCKVKYKKLVGWVSAKYLMEGECTE